MKIDKNIIVIGIPSWKWKKKLCRYARKHLHIVRFPISKKLCHENSRHFEVLQLFDNGCIDFSDTEYYKFNIENGKSKKDVVSKIQSFEELYKSICSKYKEKSPPIITDDGCRLDGSHRLSILVHLGVEYADLNVVSYEYLFSKDKSMEIRKQVKEYRKQVYGL